MFSKTHRSKYRTSKDYVGVPGVVVILVVLPFLGNLINAQYIQNKTFILFHFHLKFWI